MEEAIPMIVHLLEAMGVFVILVASFKAFFQYAKRGFNFTEDTIKIELAKALALALEFKLAGEILRTVTVRTINELIILASIVGVRILLTYVIHWEIKSDTAHCNEFFELKKKQCLIDEMDTESREKASAK